MPVFGQWPGTKPAIAATHSDHADFALERHEGFHDQASRGRLRTQGIPRSIGVGKRLDPELPLAVVAEASRLEHAWRPNARQCGIQAGTVIDGGKFGHRDTQFAEQGFFAEPVLRDSQCGRVGEHRHLRRQLLRAGGRYVLEIEGEHVHLRGEAS